MPSGLIDLIPKMDCIFSDSEHYLPLGKYVPGNYIFYVHWPPKSMYRGPNVPESPMLMPEAPAKIWCNSLYTATEIKRLWGPKWNEDKLGKLVPQVVYPPIWCEFYDGTKSFDERPFDVVMLSRLDEEKFLVLNELKGYKVAVVGSDYGFKPPPWVKLWKDVPLKTVMQILAMSKVFVHSKGWGFLKSGAKSSPEHFGQVIVEGMASGCVPVVPNVGGPVEIVGTDEEYGYMFKDVEELRSKVSSLVDSEDKWTQAHDRALARARDFDVKTVEKKVETLLEVK